ncbi:hypothetical protein I4U23_031494 [Adineta vaga]|nr:hypothetical protein I4U23_031494 [Adineta vaga]
MNLILDLLDWCTVGLAIGDALGASLEYRPPQYWLAHPITDIVGGSTWRLEAGQWMDNTSMALSLASSLITKKGYNAYDRMVRYKWWFKHGYLSPTGKCFDISNATKSSLMRFIDGQKYLRKYIPEYASDVDELPWEIIESLDIFDINCGSPDAAGNGAPMRLTLVPLFFYKYPELEVEYAGRSARLTHGDDKTVDACRYYAALIVAAGGYDDGIRGKWHGALATVNLRDDTDTTAAIYGQLAGAYYGYRKLPKIWLKKLYAYDLLVCVGEWLCFFRTEYSNSN